MAEPDLGVMGASCLVHLCISRKVPADITLEYKARELDPRFRLAKVFKERAGDDRVLFVHLAHPNFDLILFPSSTLDVRDWTDGIGNLNTDMTSIAHYGRHMDGCEAHAGFVAAIDDMWALLEGALRQPRSKKVIFCGLSRGGALAVIAALRFNNMRRLGAVVTFAQPRCVNRRVCAVLDDVWGRKYFRFAGSLDPVPLLPRGDGYWHGETLIHVTRDGVVDYRGCNFSERLDVVPNAVEEALSDPIGSLVSFIAGQGHKLEWYERNAAYVTAGMRKTQAMQVLLNVVVSVPDADARFNDGGPEQYYSGPFIGPDTCPVQ